MHGIDQEYVGESTPPGQSTGRHEALLEYNSLVLLSKIDQVDRRLNDTEGHASRALVLECLVELVNHIMRFAEEFPAPATKKCPLEIPAVGASERYRLLRPSHVRSNRLVMDDLHRDIMRNPDAFFALSNDLLRLANDYLSTFVEAFRSPRVSAQWRTLYTGFFKGIVRTIQGMQTKQPL